MQHSIHLVKAINDLQSAHEQASSALKKLAGAAICSERSEVVSPMLESLQAYQDALKDAKRHTLLAQVILSEL